MAKLNIEIEIPDRKDFNADEFRQRVTNYAQRMMASMDSKKGVAGSQLYVSERIKAMETGFVCPADMSDDYKKEMQARRKSRDK